MRVHKGPRSHMHLLRVGFSNILVKKAENFGLE